MIQFNLLPDVKLHYIKAERQKRLVLSIATILSIASIAVLVILIMVVLVFQAKTISDLGKDIDAAAQSMREIEDIDKILTVQSQLASLPSLHDEKVVSTRTFTFVSEVTPTTVSISSITIDHAMQSIEISGAAPTLKDVNTFADSLKFTTYQKNNEESTAAAFTNVVLSSITRQEDGAKYTFTMNYDPAIYDSAAEINLTVPNIISNQLGAQRPQALFQPETDPEVGME